MKDKQVPDYLLNILKHADIQRMLEEGKFEQLYQEVLQLQGAAAVGALTEILYAADIDPLKYLTFVPSNFLFGSSIREVVVPSNIIELHSNTFVESDVQKVVLPGTIQNLPFQTFHFNKLLTEVNLSEGLTTISRYAFHKCDGLTELRFPNSAEFLDRTAVCNCSNLKSIALGSSLKEISSFAFYWCPKLKDIYYNGTAGQWNRIIISYSNKSLHQCTIHCTDKDLTERIQETGEWI